MKKLILILGLCFATAGTQAVQIFSWSYSQGGSEMWLTARNDIGDLLADGGHFEANAFTEVYLFPNDAPEFFGYITDGIRNRIGFGRLETDESVLFWGAFSNTDPDLKDTDLGYLQINFGASDGDRHDFVISGHTGIPQGLPDGGTTGLLLGCGFFALVGGHHLLKRRAL